jgi:hypothetical protein
MIFYNNKYDEKKGAETAPFLFAIQGGITHGNRLKK